MEFPEIVSMIDADLELLHKVRQLLAPTSLPPEKAKNVKADRKRATRIQVPMNEFPSAAADSAHRLEPELIAATELVEETSSPAGEAVQPGLSGARPRSSRRRSDSALESSALRGSVPVGPVYVPAQAGRATVVVRKTVVEASPTLTAEGLARQWRTRENH